MATTFSITGPSSINEGDSVTYMISASPSISYSETVPYVITGINPSRVNGSLTGTVTVGGYTSSNWAWLNMSVIRNNLTDGPTTATINLGNGAKIFDIQINDTSTQSNLMTLTAGATSYNEGGTATFLLRNANPNSTYYYNINLERTADIVGLSMGGVGSYISTDSSGNASISVDLINDNLTEGSESLTLNISQLGLAASTIINDTSTANAPIVNGFLYVYTLLAGSSSVNEGSTATFTARVGSNTTPGTLIPYTLSGSGINAADISGGSLSGTAVVSSSWEATILVPLLNDLTSEGTETLIVTVNGSTASILVNDTSKATPITPTQPIITQPVSPAITTPTFTTTNSISVPTGSLAVSSTAANDLITGNTATNIIDTVAYKGSIKDYKVAIGSNGNYTVIDAVSSRDGSDVVANVERLKFLPDTTTGANRIALDLNPTQASGKAALLIGAVLPGKLALDPEKYQLMGTVIDLFDQGFSLQALSGALLRLPIWGILTGKPNPTNADIATYLVNNVYGVTSQTANLGADLARSLAIDAMNAETPATQGTYLATLALSTASQSHIDLVGIQSTGLIYLG